MTTGRMMRDIDSTVKECLYTTDEYIDVSTAYGVTFTDMIRLIYNVIYRFGNIYDNTVPIVTALTPTDTYYIFDIESMQEVSILAGNIFKYTFQQDDDYQYPNIEIDYPVDPVV